MSTNERYLIGSRGIVSYKIEEEPYTAETTVDDFDLLGVTNEDIDPPNENPHTPMPTGGVDGPYINSPDIREHEFDATTVPIDDRVPVEIALGDREEGEELSDGYEYTRFTSERPLPTATILHQQQDADLQVFYAGCKADLTISWSQDETVDFDFAITAAKQTDPEDITDEFDGSLPDDKQPYKAHMLGVITMDDGNGFEKEVATVTGGDLSISNGLEANHHGDGREAYSVSEEENAARYEDMSLDVKIEDKELYERAAENDDPVDVEIPFVREESDGVITDGIIITLEDSPIVDAPMPYQIDGSLEATIGLQPLNVEVEFRSPAE